MSKVDRENNVSGIEILTEDGYKSISKVFKTIPLDTVDIVLGDGNKLNCSLDHILVKKSQDSLDEVFAKELVVGDMLCINDGSFSDIISIESAGQTVCYDVMVDSDKHWYFTNNILSHNSGVGKTFAIGQAIRNAQEMGYLVLYYDSENAVDNEFMSNLGVKTDEMIYFPIDTAEDFKNHVVKTIGAFKKENKKAKIFIALDSLGNLSCQQEKNFIEKGTAGTDMGARAKANKAMLKELTKFCGKHQIPFVFTNHVMKPQDSNMQPQYVKNEQTGGKQATYMASAVVMMSKSKLKADEASADDKSGKDATEKLGSIMTAESRKNRLCQEDKKVKLYVSFKSGLNKYYGLVEDAVGAGVFTEVDKKNYIVHHLDDKKVHIKNLYTSKIFTDDVLQKIDEYCKKTYMYSKLTEPDDNELGDVLSDNDNNDED